VPRFKLTLEYAGTRYSGWQIQQNARTVQGELQHAIREALGDREATTYGAGRTDAGVHALAQVAHVDLRKDLPPATIVARVNEALPADICVIAAERVSPRFHARHSAVARSYVYQIARRRTAFAKPFVWWVREPLDPGAMREGARALAGLTDFRAFTDDDPEEKSTRVLIETIDITDASGLVLVHVVGSHFLWKLVRRIVGVLVEVGRGGLETSSVARLLADSDGLPARLTAPASGLFLERVYYDAAETRLPPTPLVRLG
jgi:tRNA pseudouridine38-40 synthase